MRDHIDLDPVATVVAAFVLGAAATWIVFTLLEHRRTSDIVDDETVRKRVRERVSRVASHPDSIDIDVEQGVVRLSGEVPPAERDAILSSVLEVPGVYRLRNALGVAA
jgi:osmotically-inducible protein OsmY